MKKLPAIVEGRSRNAAYFASRFAENDRVAIQNENGESSWLGFSLIITDKLLDRNEVGHGLTRARIECRPIVSGNFVQNDVIRFFNWSTAGKLSVSDVVHDRGFFVGNSQNDLTSEIDHLVRIIKEIKE